MHIELDVEHLHLTVFGLDACGRREVVQLGQLALLELRHDVTPGSDRARAALLRRNITSLLAFPEENDGNRSYTNSTHARTCMSRKRNDKRKLTQCRDFLSPHPPNLFAHCSKYSHSPDPTVRRTSPARGSSTCSPELRVSPNTAERCGLTAKNS